MNKNFNRNLIVGFGASIILLIASSVATYVSVKKLIENNHWVEHSQKVSLWIEKMISSIKDAETYQRGYLLTGNEEYIAGFSPAKTSCMEAFDTIRILTSDNDTQQENLEDLKRAIDKKVRYLSGTIEAKTNGRNPTESEMLIGKGHMDAIRSIVDQMQTRESMMMEVREERLNGIIKLTLAFVVFATLLAIILITSYYIRIKNDIVRRLQLEAELIDKNNQIQKRAQNIEKIASEISGGNYDVRVPDNI